MRPIGSSVPTRRDEGSEGIVGDRHDGGRRCPRCGETIAAADRFCPRCGEPLAPELAGRASAPPAPAPPKRLLGLETTLPLLTGGATLIATGAGLREDFPGLGLGLLAVGALVIAVTLAALVRDATAGARRGAVGRLEGLPRPGRIVLGVAAALVVGALLGGGVAGVLAPRLGGRPVAAPAVASPGATEPGGAGVASTEPASPTIETPGPSAGAVAGTATADCAVPESAAAVVAGLIERGLPIAESVDLTADDDPDRRLGTPGGYASKSLFRDDRLPNPPPRRSLLPVKGGAVEVYRRPEDVSADPALAAGIGASNVVVRGVTLLRLSDRFTGEQIAAYETALAAVVPCGGNA